MPVKKRKSTRRLKLKKISIDTLYRYFTATIIVLFIGAVLGYMFALKTLPLTNKKVLSATTQANIPTPQPTIKVLSIKPPYEAASTAHSLLSKLYTISEEKKDMYNTISILDKNKHMYTYDIINLNKNLLGFNTKYTCPCSASFKGWYSTAQFILKISNKKGEIYEYLVTVPDGYLVPNSLRRVK